MSACLLGYLADKKIKKKIPVIDVPVHYIVHHVIAAIDPDPEWALAMLVQRLWLLFG